MLLASSLSRPHRAAVEIGILASLYALYEAVRGAGDASVAVARAHTADIVALERGLHVFDEQAVQQWSHAVPLLPALLGFAYMSLHFGATALAVRWVYRERRHAFPLVRTTLIVSTALALVPSLHFGYALIVGGVLVTLARRRWMRVLGAAYPVFMLFDIVATGNHFWFDATAGGVVVVAGWWIARAFLGASQRDVQLHAAPA